VKWLALKFVNLIGWQVVGVMPDHPKMVIIAAPHTSNWDYVLFLGVIAHFHLDVRVLIKKSVFWGPLGALLRHFGGIPVDRSEPHSLVPTTTKAFDEADELLLVITPEGTRSAVDHWHSGFWRIADAADVPILMAIVDGSTKTVGFGPAKKVDGDPDAWIAAAAKVYEGTTGWNSAKVSPVRLHPDG
jgi:1-acyl-sn-glycerol-3-phosphate acyltransferase